MEEIIKEDIPDASTGGKLKKTKKNKILSNKKSRKNKLNFNKLSKKNKKIRIKLSRNAKV